MSDIKPLLKLTAIISLTLLLQACAAAVVAGHVWPVQLGFKGGRGFGPLLGGQVNQVNWGLAALWLGEHEQGLAVWAKFLLPTLSFGADLAKFRHASSLSNHLYITIG